MIKTGIIGYGKMGQIRAEAINAGNLGKLVGIMDPDQSATVDGVRRFSSPTDLINAKNPSAIFPTVNKAGSR
jgi:predicted dehydrogenase